MGDEQDALAFLRQVLHDGHELVDLLGGEHGGGLVEDEDLVVPVEHLQDLGALLHAHGDVLDVGVRVHLQAVLFGQGQDLLAGLILLEESGFGGLHAHDDVVEDREALHQLEVLMDHADAQIVGVVGVLDLDLLPVLLDDPLLRLIEAEQHAHERALAGAVLTEERVDLALPQLKGDVVIGDDTREPLGDVQHLYGIGCLRRGGLDFFQGERPPSLQDS